MPKEHIKLLDYAAPDDTSLKAALENLIDCYITYCPEYTHGQHYTHVVKRVKEAHLKETGVALEVRSK